MEQKKNKYDTNPLDPDVGRRTDEVWGARRGPDEGDAAGTDDVSGATRDINRTPPEQAREDWQAEAPTRRYDNTTLPPSYPSVFVPPMYEPPASRAVPHVRGEAYGRPAPSTHAAAQSFNQPPTSRHVSNINLPENVVLLLPYLPFPVVGAVVAAVLLFLIPRNEPRARFHASQGMALHLIVLAVSIITSTFDGFLSGPAAVMLSVASAAFSVSAFIFFIVSMIRVYKGEPHVVGPISELTRWLDGKIEPRK
jgi:uncharacterized membrane protein